MLVQTFIRQWFNYDCDPLSDLFISDAVLAGDTLNISESSQSQSLQLPL